MFDTVFISLAIPTARLVRWITDRIRPTKLTAMTEAEHNTKLALNKYKKLLEEWLDKEKEPETRQAIEDKLKDVKAAEIGYYQRILERTIERSGLPSYGELVAKGKVERVLNPADKVKLTEAVNHLEDLPPHTADDFISSAAAKQAIGRYEDALDDINKVLQLRPDDPAALTNRGIIYGNMERYDEALANFNQALHLRPDYPKALHNRGTTYYKMERYEEALADYNQALILKKDDPEALNNRGITYSEMERYEEALADYNQALTLKKDYHEALNNRGVTYLKLGRYDEARADFNRVLELEPDSPPAVYNMACLFSLTRKPSDAISQLEKAIALDKISRQKAITDSDFDNIRDDPLFKKLIETE